MYDFHILKFNLTLQRKFQWIFLISHVFLKLFVYLNPLNTTALSPETF